MKKAAFNALYSAHYHRVLGLCRRMLGGVMDAEDATQEVFMKGYRSIGKYQQDKPFGPWISAIAGNYCIDVLRRRKRLAAVFSDADIEIEQSADSQLDSEASLINAHEAEVISRAVESLPEKYRLPIVLAYYADASYEEIAAQLGIKVSNVGVLLLRAKKQLRDKLQEDEPGKEAELVQDRSAPEGFEET